MRLFHKRTSLKESGLYHGLTDYHSHILPGVDDGAQTIEESLQILSLYEDRGVKEVWLTPHIMEDIPNRTDDLKQHFAELTTVYHGEITLRLAAEYMLDMLFEERLEKNDVLPLGESGSHLLVETSCFSPPMDFYGLLERIRQKGYCPVLAHPERYAYMDEKDYLRLKGRDIKFQLNLPSIAGMYGKEVQQKALKLIEKGMYDLYGNDIHALHPFLEIISRCSYNSPYSTLASKQGQAL
ncbi:MAG: capsular biosynthesis protein [Bacteroides sp.]|uniref:tyrosine-protein phosphatase n=1 Tax=Bacteroides sp. TaxID=29523 RepID=UPI0026E0DA05|nr:CpsB/CapC family capsule biosynthesis tyrosine phosphatase [Bacteroides sp.]MDO5420588.1 capsular biosynthesis protein [Bacteroides sp.]